MNADTNILNSKREMYAQKALVKREWERERVGGAWERESEGEKNYTIFYVIQSK